MYRSKNSGTEKSRERGRWVAGLGRSLSTHSFSDCMHECCVGLPKLKMLGTCETKIDTMTEVWIEDVWRGQTCINFQHSNWNLQLRATSASSSMASILRLSDQGIWDDWLKLIILNMIKPTSKLMKVIFVCQNLPALDPETCVHAEIPSWNGWNGDEWRMC